MSCIITDELKYVHGWQGGRPETECGSGSTMRETAMQREWIPAMVKKYRIKSIADIGAGDLNWIKKTELGCDYQSYDLVPRHKDVEQYNLLTDQLPKADCLMVLWVINHFPEEMQRIAIEKLKASKARYLIMTWDERLVPEADLPYIQNAILKTRKGIDFEIRLIKL